ncbi:hypothetical protein GCM10023169_25760 [Georgenia halophila]|uniref:Uncharacterized protein n=1 Tax=Georgenia halophila TaxID=620889 RepID=A0ABP8LE57_9MICO
MRAVHTGATVGRMSETTPSEKPYDPAEDPDADPEELEASPRHRQPDQAEGEDKPEETSGA